MGTTLAKHNMMLPESVSHWTVPPAFYTLSARVENDFSRHQSQSCFPLGTFGNAENLPPTGEHGDR